MQNIKQKPEASPVVANIYWMQPLLILHWPLVSQLIKNCYEYDGQMYSTATRSLYQFLKMKDGSTLRHNMVSLNIRDSGLNSCIISYTVKLNRFSSRWQVPFRHVMTEKQICFFRSFCFFFSFFGKSFFCTMECIPPLDSTGEDLNVNRIRTLGNN